MRKVFTRSDSGYDDEGAPPTQLMRLRISGGICQPLAVQMMHFRVAAI